MLTDIIRFFHVLAATVWVGGMITVAVLVPLLRRNGVERTTIQAAARRFGAVAWVALSISVFTGILQLIRLEVELKGNTPMLIKLTLVGLSIGLTFVHQEVARDVSPALRGVMEATLLLLGLGILFAAVSLV
jgi:putative copper export protein